MNSYEKRVQQLEAEGLTASDAQGVADAELRFPIGGPRQPVYDFLAGLGYHESDWTDKQWHHPDGRMLHLYGAGSMARVIVGGRVIKDCPLGDIAE